MKIKKIKVFLGGFVNYTNAQNINCLALSEHLDKSRFEIYTLELFSGNLDSQRGKHPGVNIFSCFRPAKISIYFGFFWGIWHCDVAYLPKGEVWKFNRLLLRLLNKKSFTTIEVILDEIAYQNSIFAFVSESAFLESKLFLDNIYSITHFMKKYNFEKHKIPSENEILYLGVNTNMFASEKNKDGSLKRVLMIGNDLVRKGVYDYFEIASKYPNVNFILAGSGNNKIDINNEINEKNLQNVSYLGMISSNELSILLKTIDLHILPSRSEGFPKVTLETAAAGVPSIVYSDYGATEWIINGKNGWVLNTLDEMIATLQTLIENPDTLKSVSAEAVKLAESFDWKVKVKDWEREMEKLFRN